MPGLFVIVFFCLGALALSIGSVSPYGLRNTLGIAMGAMAVVAMSQCLILAARPRLLEPLFGGLDRMYRAHRWLGIAALGLMLAHNLIEPDFERWVRESKSGEFAEELGEVALNGLVALILLSWIKRIPVLGWEIPYQLWWFTHRLTGALFALAAVHQLLVDTPYRWTDPLAVYLNVFCVLGIGSYLFVELLARRLRRRAYRVESIERRSGATGRGVCRSDSRPAPPSRSRAPMGASIFARAGQSKSGSPAASASRPSSPGPRASTPAMIAASTCSIACAASGTRSVSILCGKWRRPFPRSASTSSPATAGVGQRPIV